MKLSIIVPCYNEEEAIPLFYDEINEVSKSIKMKFEFIFVNDGSKDKTLDVIKELSNNDNRVKYIDFSRNFGKEAAMLAGLELSSGDMVAIMDADLQDPPSLLPEMVEYIQSGEYDSVGSRRVTRSGEPPIRSFFARLFYKIVNKMSKVKMVDAARDFRLMNRKMVDALLQMKEKNRFSKGLFEYVGFKTKWLEYENIERVAGKTKWSFWKLFGYAVNGIVSFSTAPLLVATIFGIIFLIISIILCILLLIGLNNSSINALGYLVAIFFASSIELLAVGIIGIYIAKIHTEVQNRPIYIINETNISNRK